MAGELFDKATIVIKSGSGGNGAATFRREKYIPRGGPNGGDGGRGGHVYIVADPNMSSLVQFRYEQRFIASNGGHGGKNSRTGKQGRDVYVRVPVGTIVRTEIEDEPYEIDLERPGQKILAVRGGKGGLGNIHFTSSTRQAPRIAELGEPGEELRLDLELKLIADVGLVGFPNAGKSTLISVISAARPKIAPYPFTTIQPNLGIVDVGYERFVVADIPGIIEGAHRGVGLGFEFLRHVERTRLLLHIVDAAGVDGRDPVADYHRINQELTLYHAELAQRPQFVIFNKMDLPEAQANLERLQAAVDLPPESMFAVSAATREGIDPLLNRIVERLREMPVPQREPAEKDEPAIEWPVPQIDPDVFSIEMAEGGGLRVRGKKIERLVRMTNFQQPEALDRLQRVLEASGIAAALVDAGADEGTTVHIADAEMLWSDIETYG
ncbi:MAG: GTPase ObgE [Chloroflexaceae bacterium]|nr:GTPase ObgE [Chloroflexaceae bacterium]